MKKTTITNLVLGLVAAEVVYLTAQAIADRQTARANAYPSRVPAAPPTTTPMGFLSSLLHHASGMLRRLFFGFDADDAGQDLERERDEFLRRREAAESSARYTDHGQQRLEGGAQAALPVELKGSMDGIAEKLKDPAWAGVLAANDGNIALTDAERAVPMPKSAQFVQRLDRNPYIGQGMKEHRRD